MGFCKNKKSLFHIFVLAEDVGREDEECVLWNRGGVTATCSFHCVSLRPWWWSEGSQTALKAKLRSLSPLQILKAWCDLWDDV